MRRAGAIAVLALALAGPAPADEPSAGLRAQLRLLDPLTAEVMAPARNQPVRLEVTLTDAVTGQPPRDLQLRAWVRPVQRSAGSCAAAAQAFRATQRLPFGSVDLNGLLLVTLNRDDSLGVIDPRLNLQSSNMLAAHRLASRPADLATDARRLRAFVSLPDKDEIRVLSLLGGEDAPFATARAPGDLAAFPDGTLWAATAEGLARFDAAGRRAGLTDLGPGPLHLRRSADPASTTLGAFTEAGAVLMAEGQSGAVLMRADLPPLADATFAGRDAAVALPRDGTEALVLWRDDPAHPQRIPVGPGFTRLASGPDARHVIAYTPGSGVVALIDLGLGQVVQSLALDRATVSDVAFTDNAAFLLSHDGGFLGALDLGTVRPGKPAVVRRVNLGTTAAPPPEDAQLLLPLLPSPQMLAVEPENQTGWIAEELASTVEAPPMHAVRLRGGIPRIIRAADRSFVQVVPGRFEAVWAFPAGEHELVLTSGVGGLTTCARFTVTGPADQRQLRPVTIVARPDTPLIAGSPGSLALSVLDAEGRAVSLDRLQVLVPSLRSGWRGTATARADGDGVLHLALTLPHAGPYVVQPLNLPRGLALRSAALIEAVEAAP